MLFSRALLAGHVHCGVQHVWARERSALDVNTVFPMISAFAVLSLRATSCHELRGLVHLPGTHWKLHGFVMPASNRFRSSRSSLQSIVRSDSASRNRKGRGMRNLGAIFQSGQGFLPSLARLQHRAQAAWAQLSRQYGTLQCKKGV